MSYTLASLNAGPTAAPPGVADDRDGRDACWPPSGPPLALWCCAAKDSLRAGDAGLPHAGTSLSEGRAGSLSHAIDESSTPYKAVYRTCEAHPRSASMPRTVIRRPWWPLLPLLALGAEDPAPSKLSFFGSAKEPAAPSKLSFFGSASAGDARRQEDGQDSKRAAAAAADAPKRPFFGSSSAKQAREQKSPF